MHLYVNGRFLVQPVTGMQRVGMSWLCALDKLKADRRLPFQSVRVLSPKPVTQAIKRDLCELEFLTVRGPPSHFWEQITLPLNVREGLLLNLCSTGPLTVANRSVTLMHDVAVFDNPDNFRKTFRLLYRYVMPRLLSRGGDAITITRFTLERMKAHGIVPICPVSIVFNCLPPTLPPDRPSPNVINNPYFLFVGGVSANKNLQTAVSALKIFNSANPLQQHRLAVVGASASSVFSSMSDHLLEESQVLSLGRVDDHNLAALYKHASGLLFPSRYEGFGMPPIEAMSYGCPALVSNTSAMPEVCGDAALYFDPASPVEMSEQMTKIVNDKTLRRNLIVAGRERIARFSFDNFVEHVSSALQQIAERHGACVVPDRATTAP